MRLLKSSRCFCNTSSRFLLAFVGGMRLSSPGPNSSSAFREPRCEISCKLCINAGVLLKLPLGSNGLTTWCHKQEATEGGVTAAVSSLSAALHSDNDSCNVCCCSLLASFFHCSTLPTNASHWPLTSLWSWLLRWLLPVLRHNRQNGLPILSLRRYAGQVATVEAPAAAVGSTASSNSIGLIRSSSCSWVKAACSSGKGHSNWPPCGFDAWAKYLRPSRDKCFCHPSGSAGSASWTSLRRGTWPRSWFRIGSRSAFGSPALPPSSSAWTKDISFALRSCSQSTKPCSQR
mmetsp:Transcript_52251/g.117678  ORF Transcript_52251/g.117678 Transcript_52251/m.117678 type:complete len:289 (-) Transcript_52251:13-879(-)